MMVQIEYDSSALQGRTVEEVSTILHNCGFKYIEQVEVKDVYINTHFRENEVSMVKIDGNSKFKANSEFPYNADVVLKVHKKKEITIPFSAGSLRKKNYKDVCSKLTSLGFTDVQTSSIKDLVTGWIIKDGSVEKILIDWKDEVKKNMVLKYDTKFIVEYHTFKK